MSYYDPKFPHRRQSPRDVFDWLVTKQLRYVCYSNSLQAMRAEIARVMYRLTVRIAVVCFWIGVAAGAVGALLVCLT